MFVDELNIMFVNNENIYPEGRRRHEPRPEDVDLGGGEFLD